MESMCELIGVGSRRGSRTLTSRRWSGGRSRRPGCQSTTFNAVRIGGKEKHLEKMMTLSPPSQYLLSRSIFFLLRMKGEVFSGPSVEGLVLYVVHSR